MSVDAGRAKEVIVDSRINKVLSMHTDSVAMLEALDAISEFYGREGGNTLDARRTLRQDLELQNINLAKKFLVEFGEVRARIDSVEQDANVLESSCQKLSSRVCAADLNMKSFMEKASELENRRRFYIHQSQEIRSFLNRFQLSSDEIETLYDASIEQPTHARAFFEALQRLRVSYAECKSMVEQHKYSAGFELLDALGQHQDKAFQRLFEWVKMKCDNLTEHGSTAEDIDVKLQIAIRFLRDLPAYFSQCQDLVISSRRTQLVQRFVVALTQGGPLGHVFRAIDMHAHDSVRYVGDMLAWMHQAIAGEVEFLEAVFGDDVQADRRPPSLPRIRTNGLASDQEDESLSSTGTTTLPRGISLQEMLIRCLQGLGRPLRVRIMQTLEARAGLDALYSLADLLTFYEQTLTDIIPLENAVHSTVKGCLLECKRLFLSSLSKQAEALVQSPASYPLDLTSSQSTKECARQIQEILRIHSTSLSRLSADPLEEMCVDNVLGSIVQPLLQSCRVGGQALRGADMAVFMLNNAAVVKHVLVEAANRSEMAQVAVAGWMTQLAAESSVWVEVLVQEDLQRTLRRSDMDKLIELVDAIVGERNDDEVALLFEGPEPPPGMGAERVGAVLRAFYSSLFSSVAPLFERLQDPETKELCRSQAAEAVAAAYDRVYRVVSGASAHFDRSILAHTVDEVRVLLGCNS